MQVPPSAAAFNIALGALLDARQLRECLSLVGDMHDHGLCTDAANCNSLVMLLVAAAQSGLALKVAQVRFLHVTVSLVLQAQYRLIRLECELTALKKQVLLYECA